MIDLSKVHTIVFDFDGVFTNNMVYTDDSGHESVRCCRGDSLGLNILKAYLSINNLKINMFILTRESNNAVLQRANKLNIDCFSKVNNKKIFLDNYFKRSKNINSNPYSGLIYLGNDLNDLEVMEIAGYSIAPMDSHKLILKTAYAIIDKSGGNGFVREFIEKVINLDNMQKERIYELIYNC